MTKNCCQMAADGDLERGSLSGEEESLGSETDGLTGEVKAASSPVPPVGKRDAQEHYSLACLWAEIK